MKIIGGMELITVGDKVMAVSTGDATEVYSGVISLNQTAHRIWKYIEDGASLDEAADRLSEEYEDLSREDAGKYVRELADKLMAKGILTED